MTAFGLTDKQRALLTYLASRETCPSYVEMAEATGVSSKSNIYRLVTGLEERGYIRRIPNRARSIEVLVRPQSTAIPIPPPASAHVAFLPIWGRID